MNHYNLEFMVNQENEKDASFMSIVNPETKSSVAVIGILDGNKDYVAKMIGEYPEGNYAYKLFFAMKKDISDEDFENLDGLVNVDTIVNRPLYGVSPDISSAANKKLMMFVICDMALRFEIKFQSSDEKLNKEINEAYFILSSFKDVSICQAGNGWVTDIQTDIPMNVLEHVYTKVDEDSGEIVAPKMSKDMKKLVLSQQTKESFSVVWEVFSEAKNHVDFILLRGVIADLNNLNKYALVSLNNTFDSTGYTKEEIDLVQSILFECISEFFIGDVVNVETSKQRIAFGIELIYTLMTTSFTDYIRETVLSECEGDHSLFTGKLEKEIAHTIGRTLVHLHGMLSRNAYYIN